LNDISKDDEMNNKMDNDDNDINPDDLFKNEFNDLEDDFNNQMMDNNEPIKSNNLFGQSITKEIL